MAFGGPVQLFDGPLRLTPADDMALVRDKLSALADGGAGWLRLYRPSATAAFSPRDTTLERYACAAHAMQDLGFAPVERRAGGQLAVYDSHALVADLVAPHADPREHVHERFRRFSAAIADALATFGIDARVGEVAGEYCPGGHSINAGGRVKLVGVAQRIGKRAYHLGAVISVAPSAPARHAVTAAYRILGLGFNPATFGAVADFAPEADHAAVRQAILRALSALVSPA